MTREISRDYFVALSNGLIGGRWDYVLDQFHSPLIIYAAGGPHIFRSKAQVQMVTQRYQAILIKKGAQAAAVEAAETSNFFNKKQQLLVTEAYVDWNATTVGRVTARYFLSADPHAPKIEMIEYLQNPFLDRHVLSTRIEAA